MPTPEDSAADEPAADEPAADEPAADEPAADDSAAHGLRTADGFQTASEPRTADLLVALASWWWRGAVLFYGFGDTLTTLVGLRSPVVVEGSPVVAAAVDAHGLWTVVPLKLLVFACAYALWVAVPRPHNVGAPLGLCALGLVLTAWNAAVLAATL
ncbi:MAG: hypothetical protein ABEJ88_09085 [Halobacterium sp.]